MVLHFGGLKNSQLEQAIRAHLADAIACKVQAAVENVVHKPICIIAGQWSVSSKSKGNFIYTLAGEVPFAIIQMYERLLVPPFLGTTQLCPSLGWTRLLAHSIPTMAEDIRGPEALLKEIQSLPGLANVYFALQPNWVRPVERLQGPYSSISFAFSDPDGTISSKLLTGKHGLFSKEARIEKWLDKPPLVQCSRCHALGHTANLHQCPIPKGDFRCAKCGGAHTTDSHARLCRGCHAIAGVYNCKLPCLNCSSSNHDCKSHKCPAWDNFRSQCCKPTDKGKGRANTGPETPEDTQAPGDPVPGAHPAVVPTTNYPPLPAQGPIAHPGTPNQQVVGPSVLPPPSVPSGSTVALQYV